MEFLSSSTSLANGLNFRSGEFFKRRLSHSAIFSVLPCAVQLFTKNAKWNGREYECIYDSCVCMRNYTNIPCYICLMKRIHKHKTHTSRDKQFSENSILENWKIFGREKITEILQSVDRLIRSTINSKVQYTKNVRIHTSTLQITPYDFLAMAK